METGSCFPNINKAGPIPSHRENQERQNIPAVVSGHRQPPARSPLHFSVSGPVSRPWVPVLHPERGPRNQPHAHCSISLVHTGLSSFLFFPVSSPYSTPKRVTTKKKKKFFFLELSRRINYTANNQLQNS